MAVDELIGLVRADNPVQSAPPVSLVGIGLTGGKESD